MLQSINIIVPAAGKGLRMGGSLPKQYLPLNGKPILQHTLEKLFALKPKQVVLVVAEDDRYWQKLSISQYCQVVLGSQCRADSVLCGLKALQVSAAEWVMVHDAVRPCVPTTDVSQLIRQAYGTEAGGLLGLPVVDTLKQVNVKQEILKTLPREHCWLAQTPQLFPFTLLHRSLEFIHTTQYAATDEASALEQLGYRPLLVAGSRSNIKITTREDLLLAAFLLDQEPSI